MGYYSAVHRLEAGMSVRGVRGRTVGTVAVVHSSCFEVATQDRGGRICLRQDALFNVDKEVTLICSKEDVERYRCLHHAPP